MALALAATAVRAWRLAAQALWSDEDITLDRAGLPVAELLGRLPVEHPPGYFLLVRGWTLLAGSGDTALRFPSLAAGVVSVVLAGYVGSRLLGRRTGLVVGLLMAVNPFLVWYGQEARMYALLAALALAALACVLRAERAPRPWRWWVATGTLTAAAVYTHYYGAVVVLVLAAWAVVDLARGERAARRGWALAGVVAAVLFLPWLPRALAALGFPGGRTFLFQGDVWAVVTAWSAGMTVGARAATAIGVLYAVLALIGLLAVGRLAARRNMGAVRALLYLIVPLVTMALLVAHTRDFHPRYFFAALPAAYLLVAAGAVALPRPLTVGAIALLVLAAGWPLWLLYTGPDYQKQDYRAFLHTVEAAAGHEDTVLFLDGPSLGLARRYEMAESPVKIVNLRTDAGEPSADKVNARVTELAAEYPHLWLAENGAANGFPRRWFDKHAYPVSDRPFQTVTLRRFLVAPVPRTRDAASATRSSGANEPGAPVVLGFWPNGGDVVRGQVLPVSVVWTAGIPERRPLKLSVRLVPAQGPDGPPLVAADRVASSELWAAGPGADPAGLRLHRQGLLIPWDSPPGQYRLLAVLYDPSGGAEEGRWLGPTVTVEPPP